MASDYVALESADTNLLVDQLDLIGLHNSHRLLELFREHGELYDRVRVIQNRAGSWLDPIRFKKVEKIFGLPIAGQVPNAFRAFQASRCNRTPLSAATGAGARARGRRSPTWPGTSCPPLRKGRRRVGPATAPRRHPGCGRRSAG